MPEPLQIRLFGEFELRRGGRVEALPQSRKTRALLAYLVVKGAPQRREALCEVLWELPDDPRASLRWSLSKLRPLINEAGAERLVADRERVAFSAEGAWIDLRTVQQACSGGLEGLDATSLRALLAHIRGPLLEGLDLPGQPLFENWRLAQQELARRLHLFVLDALIEQLNDAPDEQIERLRARIDLEPGEEETHVRLISLFGRSGRSADAELQAELSERILSDIGPCDTARLRRLAKQPESGARRGRAAAAPDLPVSLRQDIRFCTAEDGVRIAYATAGSGPPIVKTANWLNHLEFDWESPVWRHFFRALIAGRRLVRYDSRGNGLSDWDAPDLSLEALVRDLKAVVDAAGLERFPLLAISQGCAVAVEFAVRWPERVSRLILYGGYARGWRLRDEPEKQRREALITLTRAGWGQDNPAYRQLFTSLFIPGGSREEMDWFNELQVRTASPDNAARLLSALADIDVTDKLGKVSAPTLVMHARKDVLSLANGRELATGIPGARFVTLEGQNHLILEHEPAWPVFLGELRTFLAEDGAAADEAKANI
jgi:pimeloyl-ACP methyl ester carboxylesterase/DNA-binding SARP family transcriptional activator